MSLARLIVYKIMQKSLAFHVKYHTNIIATYSGENIPFTKAN